MTTTKFPLSPRVNPCHERSIYNQAYTILRSVFFHHCHLPRQESVRELPNNFTRRLSAHIYSWKYTPWQRCDNIQCFHRRWSHLDRQHKFDNKILKSYKHNSAYATRLKHRLQTYYQCRSILLLSTAYGFKRWSARAQLRRKRHSQRANLWYLHTLHRNTISNRSEYHYTTCVSCWWSFHYIQFRSLYIFLSLVFGILFFL